MPSRYYMGGICGMGMAPLAAFLADEGNRIEGFDDVPNAELAQRLEKLGVAGGNSPTFAIPAT